MMWFETDGQYIRECILDVILDACKSVEDFCDEQGIPPKDLEAFLQAGTDYIHG